MGQLLKRIFNKLTLRKKDRISKSERLIYVVIFLWVVFGTLGILKGSNLNQVAGYYASLTLFISTYLWGEWKRTSNATKLFTKGENSTREIMIYITVFLWTVLGIIGIYFMKELNSLTVYFSSLSPFVISYIIYKTTKGAGDLPIFNGKAQELIDKAAAATDITKEKQEKKKVVTEEPKDKVDLSGLPKVDDTKDVTDGI